MYKSKKVADIVPIFVFFSNFASPQPSLNERFRWLLNIQTSVIIAKAYFLKIP